MNELDKNRILNFFLGKEKKQRLSNGYIPTLI